VAFALTYDLVVSWDAELSALPERIAGPLFTRSEPRATFADLVRGLLADVPRKNSWQLADHVGHGTAYRLEWLLVMAMLEEELAAGTPFRYVTAHPGYGRDPGLRAFFRIRQMPYVMAVPVSLPLLDVRGGARRPDQVFTELGVAAWERRSCGAVSQYQVREWTPWHRHVTTCMLALAFLSVARERAC
jgi:hypothetical protein